MFTTGTRYLVPGMYFGVFSFFFHAYFKAILLPKIEMKPVLLFTSSVESNCLLSPQDATRALIDTLGAIACSVGDALPSTDSPVSWKAGATLAEGLSLIHI